MYNMPATIIDLLSMMVFSMLAALVAIDVLSARRRIRPLRRMTIWVRRLVLAGLSLGASALIPAFAPGFLAAGLVAVLGIGPALRARLSDSVIMNLLSRAA